MDNENENISLNEDQTENNINNRDDILKFIISVIINIVIISCFISYLLKYDKTNTHLSNKNYKTLKSNENVNLRSLDDDIFTRVEKQILLNAKNSAIEDEMKKYLNLLLENLGSGFNSLHDLITGKPIIMTRDSYLSEKQKQIFLSRLMKYTYTGTWKYSPYDPEDTKELKNISKLTKIYYLNSSQNNFKIGSYKNGSVSFSFKKAIEMTTKQEALAINMKNLEGNYIDHWIEHISYAKMNDISRKVDHKNGLYIVKGEFSTSMIKGKLFNNKKYHNKKTQCNTLAEFEFPLTFVTLETTLNNKSVIIKNISTIDPSNFTAMLSSTCGFRMEIQAQIFDRVKEYYDIKHKVNYFSYLCLIGSILYLIGASCLTFSLNRNENAVSAISLECYCQNLAWHSYCGITNINFGLIYSEYFGNFCIVALFPLINFVIIDLRFLYFYWKIKKRVLSDRNFIKLRLRFFGLFYSLLFFSFFSISSFYTNSIYITILSLGMWTPQIIHNIVNNNKYIYPTFYIISTTIDRIIYPFYFRGYKYNFFQLKNNLLLIVILFCYIIITIIILYCQAFISPRFMLSSKYQKKNADFHKTKEELLETKPESINEECVICLSPLFENVKDTTNNNNNHISNSNNNNKNKNVNIVINNGNELGNSSDSPRDIQTDNTHKSFNSGIDLINNKTSVNLITNQIQTKKNINEELHLHKNNNNNSLAINVNNKNDKNHNHNNNNYNFSFKNIGKVIKIILCESMFKFYKLKPNLGNKKYMLIVCGHIFHTPCIEKWFERKKECPSCRASMEDYL